MPSTFSKLERGKQERGREGESEREGVREGRTDEDRGGRKRERESERYKEVGKRKRYTHTQTHTHARA